MDLQSITGNKKQITSRRRLDTDFTQNLKTKLITRTKLKPRIIIIKIAQLKNQNINHNTEERKNTKTQETENAGSK